MTIWWFRDGDSPPIWILKVWHLWHFTVIAVGFRVNVHNFPKIWQYAAQVWPKTTFTIWRLSAVLNLQILKFSRRIFVIALIYFSVHYFNKIWWYFIEIYRYNDFQDGDHLSSWILKNWKFSYLPITALGSCIFAQNFAKIVQSAAELSPKLCFYRAMHFSAKRGIAIARRLSVCL